MIELLLVPLAALFIAAGFYLSKAPLISALGLYSALAAARFVLRPAILFAGLDQFRRTELASDYTSSAAIEAMLIFLLGHGFLLLGYLFPWPSFITRARSWARLDDRLSSSRAFTLLTSLFIVGGTVWWRNLQAAGGFSDMVRLARLDELDVNFLVAMVPEWLILAGLYVGLVGRKTGRYKFLALFGFASAGMGIVMVASYGDRSSILLPIVSAVIVYHVAVSSLKRRTLVVFATVGITLMAAGAIVRQQLVGSASDASGMSLAGQVSSGLNLETFDTLLFLLDQDLDYRWGEDFWNGFVGPVPRSLWPDKPIAVTPGAWFRQTYLPDGKGGRPFTNEGVWYINFGPAGVALGLFITGFVLRELDLMRRHAATVTQAECFAVLMIFVFLSGVSTMILVTLVRLALPVLTMFLFVRRWNFIDWLVSGSVKDDRSRPHRVRA